ncbi:MAG: hypothetical protein H7061_00925 [Bdellovibrionaceae bacterium]|nr:hypothetical protein [Bdellovibrio sp.]
MSTLKLSLLAFLTLTSLNAFSSEPKNIQYFCENETTSIAISIDDQKAWALNLANPENIVEMKIKNLRQARCQDTYSFTLVTQAKNSYATSIRGCGMNRKDIPMQVKQATRAITMKCEVVR